MLAGSPCRFRGGHGEPFLSVSLDHRVHVRAPQALGCSQPMARLLEHRPGCGSSRLREEARRAGHYAGPQALLRVPSTRIRQAESVPEGGL